MGTNSASCTMRPKVAGWDEFVSRSQPMGFRYRGVLFTVRAVALVVASSVFVFELVAGTAILLLAVVGLVIVVTINVGRKVGRARQPQAQWPKEVP